MAPSLRGNMCSAPVIVDTSQNIVHFQSSYYYIGHFSCYIRPGAVRISCKLDHPDPPGTHEGLEVTAFKNLDGTIAVIVLNKGDQQDIVQLSISGLVAWATVPAHSIATYVLCVDSPSSG
eukprot:gnl/TRDRNA2_/TRDRNA2_164769_c0_seq1.p1 gnl/TRDRNA2_/TRDRNA2_164769_c0~~gnl/TRDRNA2_/TRDRNA2_164769_c0_seq1.p1  ORF type:complete len:120 (+),score=9.46 gnl/TRDRNA2_/TRDRNA2_164769_c0_seq1:6-365(+)